MSGGPISRDEMFEMLRAELAALDTVNLTPESDLWEFGVESAVAAGLVAAMEDRLGIHLPEDELIEVHTPLALAQVIERHRRGS